MNRRRVGHAFGFLSPCGHNGRGHNGRGRAARGRAWGMFAAVLGGFIIGTAGGCAPIHADESASTQATGQEPPPPGQTPVPNQSFEFTRIHVPAGRLSDIPLGTTRYVPMSAREFEEGVARLSAEGSGSSGRAVEPLLIPLADAARYSIARAADGSLVGTVSFDVGGFAEAAGGSRLPRGGMPREMPLGRLDVRSGSMRTAAGMGEAVVFGRRDGSLAMATPEPGTYSCEFRSAAVAQTDAATRFSLPLLPALSSSITVTLPRGIRPVMQGDVRVGNAIEPTADAVDSDSAGPFVPETVTWRIETGPRQTLEMILLVDGRPAPMLSTWTLVGIRGRQSSLAVLVQPMTPWLPGRVRLEKDASILVTSVTSMTSVAAGLGQPVLESEVSWTLAADGTMLLIDLPPASVGSREPLLITAVAPITDRGATLPLLRPLAEAWAGGGITIDVATSLSLASIELEQCVVVPPEVAARWPLPTASGSLEMAADQMSSEPVPPTHKDRPHTAAGVDVLPARLFVEQQGPHATVVVSLLPRTAELDVSRVTTVDLSPGVVVGRAACDVRVHRGESFDLLARITPGWFIDSVEAIAVPTPTERFDLVRHRTVDEPLAGLDWKVLRDTRGDVLRIGLISAITPSRGLGLRITGHRAGIGLREEFSTAELDMVRFDGESERSTLLDLRTSPETTVEFNRDYTPPQERPASSEAPQSDVQIIGSDDRLAVLVEEGASRARLWAGFRGPARIGRLVRRRPPLDARTQVRLTVRDDRLTESVTFECYPAASDLDSIVVLFSEPIDDPLEWSLLPPAVGTVTARRLDAFDRRGGASGGAGMNGGVGVNEIERWLVELNPPARGPVTIRAARTIPFVRATPVLLAWVDGATSTVGHCVVRNVGRTPPQVLNQRLTEVPPESAVVEPGGITVAEFSFTPTVAADPSGIAAAELVPGSNDARAWAWREITTSWCHASGATEYESLFDIDNHGRTSLSLSLPAGRRLQGLLLDGVRLPLGPRIAAGGEVPIELPVGRALVTLLVRTVADGEAVAGRIEGRPWPAWRVDPEGPKLDIPVLAREWRLLLPPELEIAVVVGSARVGGEIGGSRDWAARLLATALRPRVGALPSAATAPTSVLELTPFTPPGELVQGYRVVPLVPLAMPSGAAGGDVRVVVVQARILFAAAVVAALLVGFGTLLVARIRLRGAVLICLLAGVAALWIVAPFDGIARAAWWASLAALAWAVNSRFFPGLAAGASPGSLPLILLLAVLSQTVTPLHAADEQAGPAAGPLQVFVTPLEGGQSADRSGEATVLVPEELFRALIRGEDGRATAAVRVMAVRVTAAAPADGDGPWPAWRLEVDIDADTGGLLLFDQSASGGRFDPGSLRIDGGAATTRGDAGGGLLRIVVPEPGRHTVTVDVNPAVRRSGDVETATISLPPAPVATLEALSASGRTAAASASAGMACEQAAVLGLFLAARRRDTDSLAVVFDVSRSVQVRLSRSLVPGIDLTPLPATATSRNDIFWNLDACQLTGIYELDAGNSIVRSCVVRADAGLEWLAPPAQQPPQQLAQQPPQQLAQQESRLTDNADRGDGVSIRPLGEGRFLVERQRPERGRFRFEMPFRMALADPVGVFDVPEAWIEDAGIDTRSVRFVASQSLAVRIDLPAGLTHAAVPEGEASFETRFWSGGIARAGNDAAALLPAPRARLTSERRRQEIRGSQRESIVFAETQVLLHLDARLDASSSALVAIPLEVPESCVIDRIELFEDNMLHPETADRSGIDVRWSRPADTALAVVVQRPRAGRFRLEVDARLPGRPAPRGTLPGLRVILADGSRTLIEWRAEGGLGAMLEPAAADGAAGRDADGAAGREADAILRSGQVEFIAGDTLPTYVLEQAATDPTATTPASAEPPGRSAEDVAIGSGRVELADIRLSADERGRMWGLACFELVPAEKTVQIQLPRTWRLFDATVDGRSVDCVVPTTPHPDGVWELQLLDAGRPRTIVVLFVGELSVGELVAGELFVGALFVGARGRRQLDGEPLSLSPPVIVGLPSRQVIWTLQVPAGITLRVAAPARLVTAEDFQVERHAAQQRLEADVQQAVDRSTGWQRERLRGFFESRRDGAMPLADRAWERPLKRPLKRPLATLSNPLPPASQLRSLPPASQLRILPSDASTGPDAGRLTIRAVRQRDPTTRGRAIATVTLLVCGGLAWMAARSHWSPRPAGLKRLGPVVGMLAGIVWAGFFLPVWPGVLLVAGGAVGLMRTWRRPQSAAAGKPAAVDIAVATTVYRPQR